MKSFYEDANCSCDGDCLILSQGMILDELRDIKYELGLRPAKAKEMLDAMIDDIEEGR